MYEAKLNELLSEYDGFTDGSKIGESAGAAAIYSTPLEQ